MSNLETTKHILVVEDEPSIADNICFALKSEGFTNMWVNLGKDALDAIQQYEFSLVLLDVGLPDTSGFEVCKSIRQNSQVPIVFLSARGDEIDRVVGLEIGADDYIVKPFSPRELVARVKAILKRTQASSNPASPVVQSNMLSSTPIPTKQVFKIDEDRYIISFKQQALSLTTYEYGILRTLLSSPGKVFSREQLMQHVWSSPEDSFDRAVDTHIKTIRAKLRKIDANSDYLVTHRGLGYSVKEIQ